MKKIFKSFIQRYLRILTRFVLWRHKPLVVAVAGTVDKTFVKETILDELGRSAAVRGNPRSFNTEIGLPLAVLFLPSGYSSIFRWVDVLLAGTSISLFSRNFPKVLVLEMGVDQKGDMGYLLTIAKPTIAVVTRIERSFVDTGASMDDIAGEMKQLTESVSEKGSVILNSGDERVRNLGENAKAKVILYGQNSCDNARIKNIEEDSSGQKFVLDFDQKSEALQTQKRGKHNINALVIARVVNQEINRIKKEAERENK